MTTLQIFVFTSAYAVALAAAAALYPEWMVFAKGVAPVLADAAAYLGIVVVGHVVMWGVSGPAREGDLARRPSAA